MFLSTARRIATRPAGKALAATRPIHSTPRRYVEKDDIKDREKLNPESTEYSKSGGDGQSAKMEDAAFNPNKTSPESQRESAAKEAGGEDKNPLNTSPANTNLGVPNQNKGREAEGSEEETGSGSGKRQGASGGGSPPKAG